MNKCISHLTEILQEQFIRHDKELDIEQQLLISYDNYVILCSSLYLFKFFFMLIFVGIWACLSVLFYFISFSMASIIINKSSGSVSI